ncbi:MAG: hypothetical protein RL417_2559 [Pseudomonadota bacterium]|jgi:hypothetical protein
MKNYISFCAAAMLFSATAAVAAPQPSDESRLQELETLVRRLSAQVEEQQKTIDKLSGTGQSTLSAAPVSNSPSPAGASKTPRKQFLPDIGVITDIVASSTESAEDEEGNDRFSVREIELVFGHDIDPYARLDTVLTFSDFEDPDVETAMVTYSGLPYDTTARIGRMRQRVGKATAQHRDSLETVDEPLVVQRYLGIEGLFRTGLEGSGFTPLSGDSFTQELILGVMEGGVGEDGELFGETRRRPSGYGHIGNFFDISDDTAFELGGTYLIGSQDDDSSAEVQAFGIDATFIHYVTPRNKFKLQSELYLQSRDETSGNDGEGDVYAEDPYGIYVLADYRLAERWGLGARFDYVEPTLVEEARAQSADKAYNAMITFFQSEFARWRLQYQYADLADGTDDNRFFLQGTFAIGVHKHVLQ